VIETIESRWVLFQLCLDIKHALELRGDGSYEKRRLLGAARPILDFRERVYFTRWICVRYVARLYVIITKNDRGLSVTPDTIRLHLGAEIPNIQDMH
jgi:hypothetical protein